MNGMRWTVPGATRGLAAIVVAMLIALVAGRAPELAHAQPGGQVPLRIEVEGVPAADRAGFSFAVSCGAFNQTVTSTAMGPIELMVPAGQCTVRATAKTGFALVSLVYGLDDVANGQAFAVPPPVPGAIGTVVATFRSTAPGGAAPPPQGPTGNVSFDLRLEPDAPADRADFKVTITCGAFTRTLEFTVMSPQADVPAGMCTLQVTPKTGYTVRAITLPLAVPEVVVANGGATLIEDGGVYLFEVVATRTGAAPAGPAMPAPGPAQPGAGQTEMVRLFTGCNLVGLTFPTDTTARQVAGAVNPTSAVQVMWQYNNETKRFAGFRPDAPDFANDFARVSRFEAIYICVSAPAQLVRPAN
jgi:hypothetical protein